MLTTPRRVCPRFLDGVVAICQPVLDDVRCLRAIGQRQQIEVKPRQDSPDLDELSLILGPDDEREGQGGPLQ